VEKYVVTTDNGTEIVRFRGPTWSHKATEIVVRRFAKEVLRSVINEPRNPDYRSKGVQLHRLCKGELVPGACQRIELREVLITVRNSHHRKTANARAKSVGKILRLSVNQCSRLRKALCSKECDCGGLLGEGGLTDIYDSENNLLEIINGVYTDEDVLLYRH